MSSIELKARNNKSKRIKKIGKGRRSKNREEQGEVQLNPVRTSALGFAVEEKLPPIVNKRSKPNRRSVLTIENNEEWVEYIDENTGNAYYHNATTDVVQWSAPNVLFQKA